MGLARLRSSFGWAGGLFSLRASRRGIKRLWCSEVLRTGGQEGQVDPRQKCQPIPKRIQNALRGIKKLWCSEVLRAGSQEGQQSQDGQEGQESQEDMLWLICVGKRLGGWKLGGCEALRIWGYLVLRWYYSCRLNCLFVDWYALLGFFLICSDAMLCCYESCQPIHHSQNPSTYIRNITKRTSEAAQMRSKSIQNRWKLACGS